jgi:hypothetical protein
VAPQPDRGSEDRPGVDQRLAAQAGVAAEDDVRRIVLPEQLGGLRIHLRGV